MNGDAQPRHLVWLAAGLDSVPADNRWIDPVMQNRLARMTYTKRRSETTLARYAAKRTVAEALGLSTAPTDLAAVIVRNAFDGAPEVDIHGRSFDGVIAMTDRADWAVCMTLFGGGRVGCDLELVEPRSPAFIDDYFTDAERTAVRASSEPDVTANLVWSAKESALKVLRTGLRRDTRTVEVTLGNDGVGPWHPLEVAAREGTRFPGWWLRSGPFLLTCATEQETAPPESLVEPHGLTAAIPSHRWLTEPRTDLPES